MRTGGSTPSPHQGASPAGVLPPWLRSCRMTSCLNAPSVGTTRVQGSPVAPTSPPCPPLVPGEGTEGALCGTGLLATPLQQLRAVSCPAGRLLELARPPAGSAVNELGLALPFK